MSRLLVAAALIASISGAQAKPASTFGPEVGTPIYGPNGGVSRMYRGGDLYADYTQVIIQPHKRTIVCRIYADRHVCR